MIKFCPKCQVETERNKNGECKLCKSARAAIYYAENQDKLRIRNAAWRAANPEKARASDAAYRAANPDKVRTKDAAYYAANPDKMRANSAAYRAVNTESARAAVAAWKAANPEAHRIHHQNRLARKRADGGKLSLGLADKLFILQRGKCACCKKPLGNDYHIDHIIPLKLGGKNVDSNIQLLRAKCNMQKSAKHPVDFMQSRGFLL